jgi:hypothetical protein
MFSLRFATTPVFVMYSNGDISSAREGYLLYTDEDGERSSLNFIEKEGFYAYSEFFLEGDWPDKYYYNSYDEETGLPIIDPKDEESHLPEMYIGLKLKMLSGGWCENISSLLQTIPHHHFYEIFDLIEHSESAGIQIEIIDGDDN